MGRPTGGPVHTLWSRASGGVLTRPPAQEAVSHVPVPLVVPASASGIRRGGRVMARGPRKRTRIGPRTNICRETGAWSVRVLRGGRPFVGHCADAVFGGRGAALVAAQHIRDRLLLRVEPDLRVRRRISEGARSRTGEVGISRERYLVDGRAYERYVAHWQDPERGPQRRRFSVKRHGRAGAMELARGAREAGVACSRAYLFARQRQEAKRRLQEAPPMPRCVKDPRSRKGISMARRRARRGTKVGRRRKC